MSMKDSGREKTGSGQRRGADAAQEESDGRTPPTRLLCRSAEAPPTVLLEIFVILQYFFVFKLEISLLNI